MRIQLRDPNTIMKLSRLGSFHQSKLSFLRSFLNEFKDWEYKRDLFNLNKFGYGEAVYSFTKDKRTYSLVCFANEIKDDERSDRVLLQSGMQHLHYMMVFLPKKILTDLKMKYQDKKLVDFHLKS